MRCAFPVKPCFRKRFFKNDSRTLADHSEMKISKVLLQGNINTFYFITLKVALTCWKKGVHQLMATIKSFTNPFSVSGDSASNTELYNLVTEVVMSDKIKNNLCQQSQIGRRLFQTFVDKRIQSRKVNLWSTMKKRKLQTWKISGRVVKVKAPADKIMELKEDRSLFARLMMVCKSWLEVDIKEPVGLYEFSIVPSCLFAPGGTMLLCSCKSALMHILEKLTGV